MWSGRRRCACVCHWTNRKWSYGTLWNDVATALSEDTLCVHKLFMLYFVLIDCIFFLLRFCWLPTSDSVCAAVLHTVYNIDWFDRYIRLVIVYKKKKNLNGFFLFVSSHVRSSVWWAMRGVCVCVMCTTLISIYLNHFNFAAIFICTTSYLFAPRWIPLKYKFIWIERTNGKMEKAWSWRNHRTYFIFVYKSRSLLGYVQWYSHLCRLHMKFATAFFPPFVAQFSFYYNLFELYMISNESIEIKLNGKKNKKNVTMKSIKTFPSFCRCFFLESFSMKYVNRFVARCNCAEEKIEFIIQ